MIVIVIVSVIVIVIVVVVVVVVVVVLETAENDVFVHTAQIQTRARLATNCAQLVA